MDVKRWLVGLGTASLIGLPVSIANAETVTLRVGKAISHPEARCPQSVVITETSQPYEGGYNVNGSAKLSQIAGPFAIATTDAFSVTWAAKLKPEYNRCQATAGIRDREGYTSSHLRMRFTEGKVYLILDMTGLQDANGFTPEIVNQTVKNGNPVWQWAGTD